jgi:ABC-type branched-subunit amino acid transport system substrate-binding protein
MQTWKLALAAAVCTLGVATAQAQDLRIGANLPMSGPNSEYGELFSNAAKLAIEHINADKLLSKKLELVIEDSQAQPQQGVVAMNKLVNVEKVPFVLSAFTAVSKAVAPVGDKAHVVTVNGGAIGPDLAELGDYFWNVIPLVNLEVQAMAPYLVKERGWKKIELETHVPKNGGTLVAAIQVPRASQQFSGVAAKVREVSPDLVYIASFGAQQAQIAKQLRDNGVTQQLASYSAYSAPTAAQLPESKGALYTTQVIDWSGDALSQRVAKDWKAKTGKEPSAYIANYYNAVLIFAKLAQALEKAGLPVTGENLLKQRKTMASFDVVGGKLTFLPNGTVSVPLQVNETDGGAGKAVKANIVVAP